MEAADRKVIRLSSFVLGFPNKAAAEFGKQFLEFIRPLDRFVVIEMARTGDDRKFLIERKHG